jgi:microcystin-dependent protein
VPPVPSAAPTGMMFMWAGPTSGADGSVTEARSLYDQTPSQAYLVCNGAELNKADFPALSTVIGTKYGAAADPVNQFKLPDFRNRIPAGQLDADPDFGSIGLYAGNANHSHTVSALNGHTHPLTDHAHNLSDHTHIVSGNHTHGVPDHTHGVGTSRLDGFPQFVGGRPEWAAAEPVDWNGGAQNVNGYAHDHDITGDYGNPGAGTNESTTARTEDNTDTPYPNIPTGVPAQSSGATPVTSGGVIGPQPESTGPLSPVSPYPAIGINLNSVGDDSIPPYSTIVYLIAI